ncbi:hypothetical protein DDE18_06715 [Nocardioides gansuensis]|uniref:Uncharacterized protein n=1 Tax=Nocardioides gansuensis TaxID=2138300 RepID=A0A2T8FE21_9ACTN|nr:hypothetical protein [Nocardioides gansuensis]PVG83966.1 hypothetical protein DDE18_06715 [Nocardioides gansuensis]
MLPGVMVTRRPGPLTGTRPARMLRVRTRAWACSSAACLLLDSDCSSLRAASSRSISERARSAVPVSASRIAMSSWSRSPA